MTWNDTTLLRAAAARARERAGLLGRDLAAYEALTGDDPRGWLRVDEVRCDRLALCRTPRHGAEFGADILAVSAHVDVDPVALAGLLRLTEVLTLLRGLARPQQAEPTGGHSGDEQAGFTFLAAARDDRDEHTALADNGPGLPGWLHQAVERFWAEAPATGRFPRDLDLAVLVGLPLAVVELPELTVGAIATWFGRFRDDLHLDVASDRRLRAFLMALGGLGLILVDARDDAAQRRISLAHEAGHFIVEYLLPRRVVEHSRPELLDVVDGLRPPTASERLSAILGDVPIGVHTHLLDSTAPADRIDRAEWKARRVALELLAPKAVILDRMRTDRLRDRPAVRAVLVDDFGLPEALADDYAEQLLGSTAPPRPGLLNLLDADPDE